jgi:hypothetical protein
VWLVLWCLTPLSTIFQLLYILQFLRINLFKQTNQKDGNDITEILLKVALNTRKPTNHIFSISQVRICHDIAEILLKLALNTNQSINPGHHCCLILYFSIFSQTDVRTRRKPLTCHKSLTDFIT